MNCEKGVLKGGHIKSSSRCPQIKKFFAKLLILVYISFVNINIVSITLLDIERKTKRKSHKEEKKQLQRGSSILMTTDLHILPASYPDAFS